MPDRENVIASLEGRIMGGEMHKGGYIHVPQEEAEEILALLKEQEPGWISVKDRIPESQNPVIVYVPLHVDEDEDTYLGYVGMAYFTSLGDGFWCGTDGNLYGAIGMIHSPTHWMPLPEPPKEVQKDA